MKTLKNKLIVILSIALVLSALGTIVGFAAARNDPVGPVDLASCEHENKLVYKPAKESTSCVAVGNTEGVACRDCGVILVAAKSLSALEHTYGAWEGNTATCTEGGTEYRVCTVCTRKDVRNTDALGHDEISHAAQAFTCTEIGWNEYETCSRCDYTTYEELPAAHAPATAVIENRVESVCSQIGSYESVVYCSGCSVELSRQAHALAAVAHTPSEVQVYNEVAPTCTTDGGYGELVYCTVCNQTISDEKTVIKAFGHTFAEDGIYCTFCKLNVGDGLLYKLSDDGMYYTVVGIGTFQGADLVISSHVNGIPVTHVAANAFQNRWGITSVSFPSTIDVIGESAFEGCVRLSYISLPHGLKRIENKAFVNCGLRGNLVIPATVEYIGAAAITGDNSIPLFGEEVFSIYFQGRPSFIHEGAFNIAVKRIYVRWSSEADENINNPWGAEYAEIIYNYSGNGPGISWG